MAISFTTPGLTPASSDSNRITSGAANTKGSWVEVEDSLTSDAQGLLLTFGDSSSDDYLFDIGVGAAASEVVVVANIPWCRQLASSGIKESAYIPFRIAAGARVSLRCQNTVGGGTASAGVTFLHAVPLSPCTVATTYGAATADSGGTSVDPGSSANTKGAYSQITASTTGAIKWLLVGIGNQVNTTRTSANWLMDIATGGAGAEVVLIPNLNLQAGAGLDVMHPHYFSFPCDIPSGTRLAVRAQCSITDATDRLFDVILIGLGPNYGMSPRAVAGIGI